MYSRPTASARRCAMAGSPCVTYKSIKRVPRRVAGCTMPTIARPNASSSGVNVVTPPAFCVLLAACAVKGTPGWSESGATVAPLRDWAGSITAKYWLEPYTKKCVRKGEGKNFRLKNTLADVDGITRLDEKTSALSLGEALRINLE